MTRCARLHALSPISPHLYEVEQLRYLTVLEEYVREAQHGDDAGQQRHGVSDVDGSAAVRGAAARFRDADGVAEVREQRTHGEHAGRRGARGDPCRVLGRAVRPRRLRLELLGDVPDAEHDGFRERRARAGCVSTTSRYDSGSTGRCYRNFFCRGGGEAEILSSALARLVDCKVKECRSGTL